MSKSKFKAFNLKITLLVFVDLSLTFALHLPTLVG